MSKKTKDIDDNYYVEYSNKHPNLEIYISSLNHRKLNGKTIRRSRSLCDTSLEYTMVANFERGLIDGKDSTFRNDTLISVENYQ